MILGSVRITFVHKFMITSNSTNDEIERQMAIDEADIQNALSNWIGREHNRLVKAFRMRPYYTPRKPVTYHSHKTDIHWRIILVLLHQRRPSAIMRQQGLVFGVESENSIKYTIIKDMATGQPLLVLTYPQQTFFVTAHAMRRYRERCLQVDDMSFEEACDTLVRRSPRYSYYMSHSFHGSTSHATMAFRVADGMFLGYYNKEKGISHLETFISDDMLNDEQKNDSGYMENGELFKKQRDMVIGKIPFDEEIAASMQKASIGLQKEGQWRELTNKEFDEIIAMMKAEVAAMSDEEKERIMHEAQEDNRQRYIRKMKRKGYS